MVSAVTKRGHTVIPAAIRERYGIDENTRLAWIDDGKVIRVVPLPANPLAALRGRARGENLHEKLLADRRAERDNPAERSPNKGQNTD